MELVSHESCDTNSISTRGGYMDYLNFSEEEKIQFFDELINKYYNKNFGSLNKSEVDTLMFHFFMKHLIDSQKDPEKNTIDYSIISDYRISKQLGITQQQVRNLKNKSHLIYPIDFDWKKSLANLIDNAKYDSDKKYVYLNIPDPALFNDIQNYVEENGGYLDIKLNRKVLAVRVEFFLQIAIELESENNKNLVIEHLKKQFKEQSKENAVFDDKHIGQTLIKYGVDISTIVGIIFQFMDRLSGNASALALILAIQKLILQ